MTPAELLEHLRYADPASIPPELAQMQADVQENHHISDEEVEEAQNIRNLVERNHELSEEKAALEQEQRDIAAMLAGGRLTKKRRPPNARVWPGGHGTRVA